MQKTINDHYAPLMGYTLDGKAFQNWPRAMEYLETQGYTHEEAAAYLQLLGNDYMKRVYDAVLA